jgi:opine dehydrogenase
VPFGHVIYSELGRLAGVETPTIDHIIHLASTALGRDLRADALTLDRMGLSGVTKERFLELLENGFGD